MKKLFVLLSAGAFFGLASCATKSSCCGTCKTSKCCASADKTDCTACKKSGKCCGTCTGKKH